MRPLEVVLEREYFLCKHIPGFNLSDIRNTSSLILEWFQGRIIKDYQDQEESQKYNG